MLKKLWELGHGSLVLGGFCFLVLLPCQEVCAAMHAAAKSNSGKEIISSMCQEKFSVLVVVLLMLAPMARPCLAKLS